MSPIEQDVAAPLDWTHAGGLSYLKVKLGNARAVFTARNGGVSEGPYESLNLGVSTGDDPRCVARNVELLAKTLDRDRSHIVFGKQAHGIEIDHNRVPRADSSGGEADGQLAATPDLTPMVLVADCYPLALAAPSAVAAVHCGWKGIAEGIVAKSIAALCAESDCSEDDLHAAIGPGIGPCCYEVGSDLLDRFAERGHRAPGNRLDLGAVIMRELLGAGLSGSRIASADLCTSCRSELFFSHRRDGGVTGRQAGLTWLAS